MLILAVILRDETARMTMQHVNHGNRLSSFPDDGLCIELQRRSQ